MARFPRVYIEGAVYYVTAKSSESRQLFVDFSDYKEYLSLIIKYKNQFGFKLFSYALMDNHIHMLIELKNDIEISKVMHSVNSLYTKLFNSRYGKKGHVFQERFKAVIAEKDPYILPLIRHIHLSPKRSGIQDDPKEYPYSSHPLYTDPVKRDRIEMYPDMREEIKEVFNVIKGSEEKFDNYVTDVNEKEIREFKKSLHRKRILGSKVFVERIQKAIEKSVKERKKAKMPKKQQMIYMVFGGSAILVFAIATSLIYKNSMAIKSNYEKTVVLYASTIRTLEVERDRALKVQGDIEEYTWKIHLAEKALKDLNAKHEKEIAAKKEIEGYSWKIELRQTSGSKETRDLIDTVSIRDHKVASVNLSRKGFNKSGYSRREKRGGKLIIWETMQLGPNGAMANWRGEWDGENLRGVLRKKDPDGTVRDFSFKSVGQREKIEK
ncbi:MAG: transposase [Candidatus Omnitrophica bacterium]|nr:transposase [Candidatus Omnitrophota bacterium]